MSVTKLLIATIEDPNGYQFKVSEAVHTDWHKEIWVEAKPIHIPAYNSRRSWRRKAKLKSSNELVNYINRFQDIERALEVVDEVNANQGLYNDDRDALMTVNQGISGGRIAKPYQKDYYCLLVSGLDYIDDEHISDYHTVLELTSCLGNILENGQVQVGI